MINRHVLGDVGRAVLLVAPTLALSRPEVSVPKDSPVAAAPAAHQLALTERQAFGARVSRNG